MLLFLFLLPLLCGRPTPRNNNMFIKIRVFINLSMSKNQISKSNIYNLDAHSTSRYLTFTKSFSILPFFHMKNPQPLPLVRRRLLPLANLKRPPWASDQKGHFREFRVMVSKSHFFQNVRPKAPKPFCCQPFLLMHIESR